MHKNQIIISYDILVNYTIPIFFFFFAKSKYYHTITTPLSLEFYENVTPPKQLYNYK